jgi:large subunit ribosomal protein L15
MKFNELQSSRVKSGKRVGRGIAAGQGKTAGRGTKGQMSRTGSSRKPGFEGGQNPLMQRLPKLPGFKSHRVQSEVVYTGQLDTLGAKIDTKALAEAGLISNAFVTVKLIVQGEVTKKHDVKLQSASAGAVEAVQKAGGSFERVIREERPITRASKEDRRKK